MFIKERRNKFSSALDDGRCFYAGFTASLSRTDRLYFICFFLSIFFANKKNSFFLRIYTRMHCFPISLPPSGHSTNLFQIFARSSCLSTFTKGNAFSPFLCFYTCVYTCENDRGVYVTCDISKVEIHRHRQTMDKVFAIIVDFSL